jgi:hypothetical protein
MVAFVSIGARIGYSLGVPVPDPPSASAVLEPPEELPEPPP